MGLSMLSARRSAKAPYSAERGHSRSNIKVVFRRVVSAAYQGRCWRLGLEIGPARVRLDWPQRAAPGETLAFSLPLSRRSGQTGFSTRGT